MSETSNGRQAEELTSDEALQKLGRIHELAAVVAAAAQELQAAKDLVKAKEKLHEAALADWHKASSPCPPLPLFDADGPTSSEVSAAGATLRKARAKR